MLNYYVTAVHKDAHLILLGSGHATMVIEIGLVHLCIMLQYTVTSHLVTFPYLITLTVFPSI